MDQLELTVRRELARAARNLYRQGMMPGSSGNLSARLGADRILITPSGAPKGRLRPADLILIDLEGSRLNGTGRPSTETGMHTAIYRRHPEVRAVIHAHPVQAGAMAVCHRSIPVDTLPEGLIALGGVPTVPFIPPATPELGAAVAEALSEADAALLLNHGTVTIGKSVEAARSKMEVLEALAATAILTEQLGGRVALPAAELDRLRAVWRQRRW